MNCWSNADRNGRLWAEHLNENRFLSLDEPKTKAEAWRRHYNKKLPHNALGYLASREFAANGRQFNKAR